MVDLLIINFFANKLDGVWNVRSFWNLLLFANILSSISLFGFQMMCFYITANEARLYSSDAIHVAAIAVLLGVRQNLADCFIETNITFYDSTLKLRYKHLP